MNLLFGMLIFVTTYIFAFKFTKNTFYSFLSMVFLALFLPFSGQIGVNPIDIPFTIFYFLSLLGILVFSKEKRSNWQLLLLGVLFGISQGLRQLGLTLYILLFIADLFEEKNLWETIKKYFFEYIVIFVIATFFMLITWPNFAVNFFKSSWWYLFIGSNFYLWDFGLFFMGDFLENAQRPWFYLPLLQIITSPMFILVLFGLGVKYFKKLIKNKVYLLLVCAFGLNYLLYFVLKPVLYDGTRHFLHLVPIFVLLAVFHLKEAMGEKSWFKNVLAGFVVLNVVYVSYVAISRFPYHSVYFNQIANVLGNPYHLFESDYSSTLYKESAVWVRDEYLKAWEGPETLKVWSCDNGYAVDYYSHKEFLTVINRSDADLIICGYKDYIRNGYEGEVIYSVSLDGTPVNFVIDPKKQAEQ